MSEPETIDAGERAYHVRLPDGGFEGPLDLLLYLCQKHELDILDIPIAFVTEKYLEYIAVMTLMDLDLAADYLVMAATLAHIKSKMLLPAPPPGQEDDTIGELEEDPREALIRRLLEYQKYKKAGEELQARGVAGRDVFLRGAPAGDADPGPAPLAEIPLFRLVEAFGAVLARTKVRISHDVVADRISINDRIHELADLLRVRPRVAFDELFSEGATRSELVITFLALLEMTRLKMTRLSQEGPDAPLLVEMATGPADPGVERTDQVEPP